MITRAGFFVFILALWAGSKAQASHINLVVKDSTRVETKNGQTFVIHRVESGQTLYAVMRKYKTTLKAIKDANPGLKDNLVTGQVLRIPSLANKNPSTPKVAVKEPEKKEPEKSEKEEEKIVIDLTMKEKAEQKAKSESKKEESLKQGEPAKTEESAKQDEPNKTEESAKTTTNLPKPVDKTPEKVAEKPGNKSAVFVSKNGLHRVEAGQSLYGIAVRYGVLMADIRQWNNLTSDQLRLGQDLIVTEIAYQDYLKKNKTDTVRLVDARKSVNDKLPTPPREDMTNANLPEPKIANTGKRILETGVAEVIDGMDSNNKYLALHRTAPVGSLVQVKNISNSSSVWVKVIGKLPDISANNRIIIKLSARAQEKLSPGGRQFMAEISYLTQ